MCREVSLLIFFSFTMVRKPRLTTVVVICYVLNTKTRLVSHLPKKTLACWSYSHLRAPCTYMFILKELNQTMFVVTIDKYVGSDNAELCA